MTFIYVVRPKRDRFAETVTPAEREILARHFQHLKSAHAAGKVSYVGRCADAAIAWATLDPAVSEGLFSPEVREFVVVMR